MDRGARRRPARDLRRHVRVRGRAVPEPVTGTGHSHRDRRADADGHVPDGPPLEPTPTPTPEPELSLPLPEEVDPRRVSVSTAIDLPSDGDGVIVVTVASGADSLIDELVLRWPIELHETLFPAPFIPSGDRIRDGGEPLVQPWTKWVLGPGERGEPEGTVSLGYGPLLAGATLEIPLYVTRNAPGPVSFDLQVLAGEAILTLGNGEPAELRLEVP
jgi:hypothetical protein